MAILTRLVRAWNIAMTTVPFQERVEYAAIEFDCKFLFLESIT